MLGLASTRPNFYFSYRSQRIARALGSLPVKTSGTNHQTPPVSSYVIPSMLLFHVLF